MRVANDCGVFRITKEEKAGHTVLDKSITHISRLPAMQSSPYTQVKVKVTDFDLGASPGGDLS